MQNIFFFKIPNNNKYNKFELATKRALEIANTHGGNAIDLISVCNEFYIFRCYHRDDSIEKIEKYE